MWVFLDIDGVLVPEKKFENLMKTEDFLKFDPICLELFESVLQTYPDVLVGISSSWRDLFTLETVRSLFSENIASRVIGFTPLLDSESNGVSQYYRYHEILEFLRDRNAEDDSWLAINDTSGHYPPDTRVVITDSYHGFDKKAALALEECLSTLATEKLPLAVF